MSDAIKTVSYTRGSIASLTVFGVGFGLKSLGVDEFWCLLAAMSLLGAWVVGFGAAAFVENKP
ncbi:hypothetical protein ACMAY6_08190 [Luminiphilus sp. nBUS_16]|uniref:hypothetical protein n=1 Tax=Luminiphilus sp. nBUS_16 TaxID=3395315 RepID=UPI003EC0F2E8